jgi:hypothetical protein
MALSRHRPKSLVGKDRKLKAADALNEYISTMATHWAILGSSANTV